MLTSEAQDSSMVCTKEQICLLMRHAKTQSMPVAAAKAGMSLSSAKRYIKLGGKRKPRKQEQRQYRTRKDPFAEVWTEVKELLECDSGLEAKTIMEWLLTKYPAMFEPGQVRTLRRRIKDWRVLEGPERKEVFFAQKLIPGAQSQSDYTWCNALEVTIDGELFPHLLYHFMLPFSRWEFVWVCHTESYETLTLGYRKAVQMLGAVALEHRTDNLAAAVPIGGDRHTFQKRWLDFLAHYGVKPSANNPGCSNENGSVEKSNHLFKHALDQRLRLRGSRNFASLEEYEAYLSSIVSERNTQRQERLAEEMKRLTSLPAGAWNEAKEFSVSVTAFSTISIDSAIYSVPSRFISVKLKALAYHDKIKVYYGRHLVLDVARIRSGERNINYRHIIFHLMRKPGAFRGYQFREELFPRVVFRRAYDKLCAEMPERADKEYLRILHQASLGEETTVAIALQELLTAKETPTNENVRQLCEKRSAVPEIAVTAPRLEAYDNLLKTTRRSE